jgi:hypothetical protein
MKVQCGRPIESTDLTSIFCELRLTAVPSLHQKYYKNKWDPGNQNPIVADFKNQVPLITQEPDAAVTRKLLPSLINATEDPSTLAKARLLPRFDGVAPAIPAKTNVPLVSRDPVNTCAWAEADLKTNKPPATLAANGIVIVKTPAPDSV